jgi:O-Antigen ligase
MSELSKGAASKRGIAALCILAALVLATGIDRFIVRVESTNFRVELLVGGVAFLAGVALLGRASWRALGLIEWLLLAWLALSLALSILFSPQPADSVKLTVLLAGLVVIFLATVLLLRSREGVFWCALLWVAIGSGVVLLGLVQGLLFTFFGITKGMHFNRTYEDGIFSAIPMVTGTVWEPNLFGSYSLAVGAMAAGLAFAPQLSSRAWQWRLHMATALGFAGVVVSMTRTVWLVAAVVIVALALSAIRFGFLRFDLRASRLAAGIGTGVVVGLLVALTLPKISWKTDDPGAMTLVEVAERAGRGVRGEPIEGAVDGSQVQRESALEDRAGELAEVGQVPSLLIRQEVMVNSFNGWLQRPLLGWGSGAYRHVFAIAPGAPNWIPNIFMHVLFDTGLVGLALFGGALGLAGMRAMSSISKPARRWTSADFATYGLLLAWLSLLLTYQLTDGTWMGFTWVLLAMLVASGRATGIVTKEVGQ